MEYLLSMKKSHNSKPIAQRVMDSKEALNFVRKAILGIQSMDETSADLRAMDIMFKTETKPQAIINHSNGHTLVIQERHH